MLKLFEITLRQHWKKISLLNFNITNNFYFETNYKTTNLEIFNASLKSLEILINFKNLVKFNSTKNQIKILKEKFIVSKKLQIFIIKDNFGILKIEFFNFNKNLESLLFLMFTSVKILEIPSKFFQSLNNLTFLSLNHTILTNIDKHLFQSLSNLKILRIDNLKIIKSKRINGENFKYLKSLHTLISSKSLYCCYFYKRTMKECLPKRKKDTSSCNYLISSKILKGLTNIYFI